MHTVEGRSCGGLQREAAPVQSLPTLAQHDAAIAPPPTFAWGRVTFVRHPSIATRREPSGARCCAIIFAVDSRTSALVPGRSAWRSGRAVPATAVGADGPRCTPGVRIGPC